MSTRFDICAPRPKKDGGTYWTKIGTAWQGEKGIQLVFDSLPIPDGEGRVVANLFEPREPQQRPQQGSGRAATTQPRESAYDDMPGF